MTEQSPQTPEKKEEINFQDLVMIALKAWKLWRVGSEYYRINKESLEAQYNETIQDIKDSPLDAKKIIIGSLARVYSGYLLFVEQDEKRRAEKYGRITSSVRGIADQRSGVIKAESRTQEARDEAHQATEDAVKTAVADVERASEVIKSVADAFANFILGPEKKKGYTS